MHSVRQTNPKLGSCKRTTLPGKEVGGEKWQARDKGSSEASQGGDEHLESRIIAKSEDGADMGFGRITSGKALGLARGEIYHAEFFFSSLSKFLLYSLHGCCWSIQKYSFHVLLTLYM